MVMWAASTGSAPRYIRLERQLSWRVAVTTLGMFSKDLAFLENSSCLTSLTSVKLLVRSYISITNRSITLMHASSISSGIIISASRMGVSSAEYTFHTSHAVFFPLPLKKDTVSHPVRAWNIGNTRAFCRPQG